MSNFSKQFGWEVSQTMESSSPKGYFTSLMQLRGCPEVSSLPLAKQSTDPSLWEGLVAWY